MSRQMPPLAFIFDVGNVLVQWDPHTLYAPFFEGNRGAIDSFLEEIDFFAWNIQQDKGRSFAQGVNVLSAQFPHYAHLIRAYDTHWENCIPSELTGTVEIVQQIKQAGHALYGLTNFSSEKFPLLRRRFGFFDLFDDIFVSGEIGMVKPDPEIYLHALQRINRPPEECVFIDDSSANTQTAQALGFISIHFTNPAQLGNDLRKHNLLD